MRVEGREPSDRGRGGQGWPAADRLVLLALVALHAAAYAYVTVITDTARDVGQGWRIAHGEEFPLLGPYIGGRWKLGPVWFYVLAVLVAAGRSLTAVSVGVGALAALKLVFAYALGRRIHGRACGLAWAALLALPGWGSIEQVVFTHFNLVETTVLGTFLAAHAAWQAQSALRFAVVGLALSLALHAHPTALVAAPVVLAAWWAARGASARLRLRGAAAIAAGGVLPLVPMLASEARTGFRQLGATFDFVGEGGFGARLAQAPGLVVEFLHNHYRMADFVLQPLGAGGHALAVGTAALLAAGAVAALTLPGRVSRRARWVGAAYCAASIAGASALRHPASAYFFFAALPLVAGIAALGWAAVSERIASERRALVGLALAAFALLASLALLRARANAWREGWQRLPNAAIAHVGNAPDPDAPPSDFLPVFALDALGRAACEAPDGLTVHGDAGTLLELAHGLPVWIACGRRADVRVGGRGAPLAGFPAGLWRAAGVELPADVRGYVWFRDLEAFDTAGHTVVLHERYPPYVWERKPLVTWSASAAVAEGDWIAVTQLNPQLVRVRKPELELDGLLLAPAAQTRNTWLYRVERGGTLAMRVMTDDPSWLGVIRTRVQAVLAEP